MSETNGPNEPQDSEDKRLGAIGDTDSAQKEKGMWSSRTKLIIASYAGLIVLLIAVLMLRTQPVADSQLEEQDYSDLYGYEALLEQAASGPLYQPVGRTIEEMPFLFTIEGFAADNQRMLVYYTVDKEAQQNYELRFLDQHGDSLGAMSSYGNTYSEQAQTRIEVADFNMMTDQTMPEQILLRLNHPELEEPVDIEVAVDPEPFHNTMEQLVLDKVVESDGQTILIQQAIISPLQTTLVVQYEDSNSKLINGLIDLQLTDGQGRGRTSFASVGGGHFPGKTQHFFNGYFNLQPLEELSISWAGLQATDKNQHIVIDLPNGRLLQAPDDRLSLLDARSVGGEWTISFLLSELEEKERRRSYRLISDEFQDDTGEEYTLSDRVGVSSIFSSDRNQLEIIYQLPGEDYEQPLTFDVVDYPGFVEDPIELKLK